MKKYFVNIKNSCNFALAKHIDNFGQIIIKNIAHVSLLERYLITPCAMCLAARGLFLLIFNSYRYAKQ
jgi:hypothetical protein